MHRITCFSFYLFILGITVISCQPTGVINSNPTSGVIRLSTPTNTSNLIPSPVSAKFVRLAWFYKPPDNGLIDPLAQYFDFFILTHKDEPTRDLLQAKGVTGPIYQYILLAEIMDPGDCTVEPYGNQVAYKVGDFCQISKLHPDWFLLDQNGNRIQSTSGFYYMDPGNIGYRDFWLERASEMQALFGWNGVFIDNLEASRKKFTDQGTFPAKYPNDKSYQAAIEGFLSFLRNNYFQPTGRLLSGNIVSVDNDNVWSDYLQYLDAAMIEAFATNWSDGYLSPVDWERQMSLTEAALEKGKTLILVSQGDQTNTDIQRFAFASYLLVTNGQAIFRYSNSNSYREVWIYNDYTLNLGAPLGLRKPEGWSWRRDFTNGYVIVNPWTHSVQITVKP